MRRDTCLRMRVAMGAQGCPRLIRGIYTYVLSLVIPSISYTAIVCTPPLCLCSPCFASLLKPPLRGTVPQFSRGRTEGGFPSLTPHPHPPLHTRSSCGACHIYSTAKYFISRDRSIIFRVLVRLLCFVGSGRKKKCTRPTRRS